MTKILLTFLTLLIGLIGGSRGSSSGSESSSYYPTRSTGATILISVGAIAGVSLLLLHMYCTLRCAMAFSGPSRRKRIGMMENGSAPKTANTNNFDSNYSQP